MWPFDLPELEESIFWESSQVWGTCSLHFKDKNYNAIELCKYNQRITLRINSVDVYEAKAFNQEENDITVKDIIYIFSSISKIMISGFMTTMYPRVERNLLSGKVFGVHLENRGSSFLFRGYCAHDASTLTSIGEYIQEVGNFIPECITRRCPDVAV